MANVVLNPACLLKVCLPPPPPYKAKINNLNNYNSCCLYLPKYLYIAHLSRTSLSLKNLTQHCVNSAFGTKSPFLPVRSAFGYPRIWTEERTAKSSLYLDKLFFANDEFDTGLCWERNTIQNKDDYAGGSPSPHYSEVFSYQRISKAPQLLYNPPSKYSLSHPERMYLGGISGTHFKVSLSAICSERLKKITLLHELQHESEKCVKIHWGICWWWSI